MSNITSVIKELSLDLSNIPPSDRKKAKDDVRGYLENEILREVSKGISPVEGEGRFRILKADYAKREKGGVMTANLQDEGDLLDALKSKNLRGDKIEIGIRGKEAPKADGHNQLSSEAKAWAIKTGRSKYKRRFIPSEEQNYTAKIMKGISSILDEYRIISEESNYNTIDIGNISSAVETPEKVGVTVNDMFSDEIINSLLEDALKRGGL